MAGNDAIARRAIARCTGVALLLCLCAGVALAQASKEDRYARQRSALIAEIRGDATATLLATGDARFDHKVLDALLRVPRHAFVPAAQRRYAYENRPLSIGYGQTISQPYIVALMTDLARPQRGHKVLEIGTGSGYQAAVLAELVDRVYSIEFIEPLGKQAAKRLRTLGYDNIETTIGDGYYGWKQHAPFDAIVVTAAAASVPPPLLKQLKPGGRLVIPVGSSFFTQTLLLVEKRADGKVHSTQVLPVRFVPLTGGH